MFILDRQPNGVVKLFNLLQVSYGEMLGDGRMKLWVFTSVGSVESPGILSLQATKYLTSMIDADFTKE